MDITGYSKEKSGEKVTKEEVKQQLLGILLAAKQPVTLAQLAGQVGVSAKSIRNYLEEFEQDGVLGALTLVRKPNVGIYLEQDEHKRADLQRKLQLVGHRGENLSPEARQQYILKTLFKNRYTYTIQLLAEDLYVGKNTIVQDLAHVEIWLQKHGLKLQRKPNRGLWIEGNEYIFRRAMMDLFSEVHSGELVACDQEIEQLDYRIDFVNFTKIKQMFPKFALHTIQTILQQAEEKLGYVFTDEAFINLIIHIAIALERIKQAKEVAMDEERLQTLALNAEFQVAEWVVGCITEELSVIIPRAEVGYISLHMLGARVQKNIKVNNFEYILGGEEQEYIRLAQNIIGVVGGILDVDLAQDKLLLTGLALHLRPSVTRIRHGMKLRNPLLEQIKREYTSIFGAAWVASDIFEKTLGVTINEEEVGYIAMHIGTAVERLKHKVKTIVVCASGVGTSQLVAVRLERELTELDIIEIIAVNQLSRQLLESVDLCVSTVMLRDRHEKIVHISTLVDKKDILAIREALRRLQEGKRQYHYKGLPDIISNEYCFTQARHHSKEEVIRIYGRLLEEGGYTRLGFIESALTRESLTSTAVGKGVAIPHGHNDFVIRPKICIISLAQPITWHDETVDVVILLALNAKFVRDSFFKTFYAMLDEEAILAKIRSSGSGQEMADIFQ